MIRKHIREHSLVYQLLLILGGILVLGGGFILAVKKMQSTRETAYAEKFYTEEEIKAVELKPEDQTFPQPIGNETYGLRQVLRYALEAQGGREALENIRTLRRIGDVQLFENGEPQTPLKATIIYRKPDMLRYTYQTEERSITTCYDGSSAWWQPSVNGVNGPPRDLEPKTFSCSSRTSSPSDRSARHSVTSSTSNSSRRNPPTSPRPIIALNTNSIGITEVLYFNKENFLCERRDTVMSTSEGKAISIRLEYEDFRYVEGLAFPFLIRVWVDGAKRNELALQSVEVNIGVLAKIFSRPGK